MPIKIIQYVVQASHINITLFKKILPKRNINSQSL